MNWDVIAQISGIILGLWMILVSIIFPDKDRYKNVFLCFIGLYFWAINLIALIK
jgi:hypothetical protein